MDNDHLTSPVPPLQPIHVRLPAEFEQAFELYHLEARWLGLYWEPQLSQPCYTDGETVGISNTQSWQLFRTHPDIKSLLLPYRLGDCGNSVQHYLVLDRKNQQLYVGEADVVIECLQHPSALDMLAQLNQPREQSSKYWQNYLSWQFVAGRKRLFALLSILLLALGYGVFSVGGEYVSEVIEDVFEE